MSKESKRTNTGYYEHCWSPIQEVVEKMPKGIEPGSIEPGMGDPNHNLVIPAYTVLEEAATLVDGHREATYGHPVDDFGAVSGAARILGVDPQSGPLHHALYMVLVKIQRLVQTPDHRDSIVDGAGYFRCYEKVLEKL